VLPSERDDFLRALGEALREERERRGLTQEGWKEVTGRSKRRLHGIEHGEHDLRVGTFLEVCEGLGVSPTLVFARAEGIWEARRRSGRAAGADGA